MNRVSSSLSRVRRAVLARRRLLAGVLVAVAVAAGLQAASAPPPRRVPVLVAAHDVAGGVVLHADDLTRARFAPGTVPDGAVRRTSAVEGRVTTTPVRAGEPVTDVRLLRGSLLDGYPGAVAAPVRIADAGAVGLLRVGDRVDILAADPRGESETRVVAARAPVIALPGDGRDSASGTVGGVGASAGGLVVLAVPADTARELAAAAVQDYLSVVLTQ
ncbi:MAG TPA: RcpC/CpaB family pilus assembly protein [Nocardioidaceae bacterium]|jgi:Flp pilus assembly protein CpaB|nr:RcpC/CpaB family pilus assembly protein [Nocardioidaceae bacterium]